MFSARTNKLNFEGAEDLWNRFPDLMAAEPFHRTAKPYFGLSENKLCKLVHI